MPSVKPNVRLGLALPTFLLLVAPVSHADLVSLSTESLFDLCEGEDVQCPASDPIGTVVAEYTDGNGNSAQLIKRDDGLSCSWDASKNTHTQAGFVPAFYYVQCYVRNAKGGPNLGPSPVEDATAAGELLLLDWIPKADLRWSVIVKAYDWGYWESTTEIWKRASAERWWVEGDMGASVTVGIDFLGDIPIPSLEIGGHMNSGGGYENTNYVEHVTETTVRIRERHALMLGFTDKYVALKPRIESLSWSAGKHYGCDALNLVELLLGEREIGTYSVHLKAVSVPGGTLAVSVYPSIIHRVVSWGDFQGHEDIYGLDATFGGTPVIDSTITFEVNYEYPDPVPVLGELHFEQGPYDYQMQYGVQQSGDGLLAQLLHTNVPTSQIARTQAFLSKEDLAAAGNDLGSALARAFLEHPEAASNLSNAPVCGFHINPPDPQTWTVEAALNTAGPNTARTATFNVDVYMDLAYAGGGDA